MSIIAIIAIIAIALTKACPIRYHTLASDSTRGRRDLSVRLFREFPPTAFGPAARAHLRFASAKEFATVEQDGCGGDERWGVIL